MHNGLALRRQEIRLAFLAVGMLLGTLLLQTLLSSRLDPGRETDGKEEAGDAERWQAIQKVTTVAFAWKVGAPRGNTKQHEVQPAQRCQ